MNEKDIRLKPDKLAILRNNIDHDFWKPSDSKKRVRHKNLKLLYAGPISFFKGIYHIIDVCDRLKDVGENFKLSIVGDWWGHFDKEPAISKIKKLGLSNDIVFIPKVDKTRLREYYRASDLLIYQSMNEGSPRIVLEAISCGLPVIASNHPGIAELDLEQQYINFTDYGDIDKIVSIIRNYVDNPNEFISKSQRGRRHVVENFSTPAIAQDYIHFYHSIADKFNESNNCKS